PVGGLSQVSFLTGNRVAASSCPDQSKAFLRPIPRMGAKRVGVLQVGDMLHLTASEGYRMVGQQHCSVLMRMREILGKGRGVCVGNSVVYYQDLGCTGQWP